MVQLKLDYPELELAFLKTYRTKREKLKINQSSYNVATFDSKQVFLWLRFYNGSNSLSDVELCKWQAAACIESCNAYYKALG